MKDLSGRLAVVTGGGSGMGRELVRQLVAEGCSIAACDVSVRGLSETVTMCEREGLPQGVRITTHIADVSDETQVLRFRDEAAAQHQSDRIHLLFNNAGIGGGSSMFVNSREEWERTFNICWGGVYLCTRAFLPMLQKADKGHIVNTSSVNGFWAQIGINIPQTAYSAAKFAVKGFSEALQTDLRLHAPHIKCSVVMPGHIGTGIAANTGKVQAGNDSDTLTPKQIEQARARLKAGGIDVGKMTDADIEAAVRERAAKFVEQAPMTAAQAASVILDGVKADRWRILVGEDAHKIDEWVRRSPEQAYDVDFFQRFAVEAGWKVAR
jgi:NAD(P)-dependent dehydrogenase (short-subunit alcohol dehydrogenase family)